MSLVVTSSLDFETTVATLETRLTSAGNTIFGIVDQARAAESAGLELRPTTLVIFGNPKAGTPLMVAEPLVALDLPLKILVWQIGDVVYLAYDSLEERYAARGLDAPSEPAGVIDGKISALLDSFVAGA